MSRNFRASFIQKKPHHEPLVNHLLRMRAKGIQKARNKLAQMPLVSEPLVSEPSTQDSRPLPPSPSPGESLGSASPHESAASVSSESGKPGLWRKIRKPTIEPRMQRIRKGRCCTRCHNMVEHDKSSHKLSISKCASGEKPGKHSVRLCLRKDVDDIWYKNQTSDTIVHFYRENEGLMCEASVGILHEESSTKAFLWLCNRLSR